MTRQKIERISITLPAEVLRLADREARRLNRPRSWVIAEALRRYQPPGAVPVPPLAGVRETVRTPYDGLRSGLGELRTEQLRRDLTLTPEDRVRAAEESVRLSEVVRRRPPLRKLIFFDRFEEYLAWKDLGRIEG